jgi:glycosyltransferase involved in cell wall biosynthesis
MATTRTKIRVLYIIASLGAGGKERRFIELLKGLRKGSDIECALIVMSGNIHYDEILDFGLPIYYFPRDIVSRPRFFLRFFRICTEYQPHIVHSWDSMASLYFGFIVRLLGIKLVNASIASAQTNMSWRKRKFIAVNQAYPVSNVVVANSHAGLEAFKVPVKKGITIYNGFDFNRLNNIIPPVEIRNRFGVTTKHVVGMVAAFTALKDYETFVKAAQMVLEKKSGITFVAVGDGPDRIRIESMVLPRYRNEIMFLGRQRQIEAIINVFNMGILSTFSEGLSNSIMEYMALEKPVIASVGGGTSELVVDGETGYLIEPRNPQLLAEKILLLLDNPDIAHEMGKKGKERIIQNFNSERMISETNELYKKVLNYNQ